MMVIVEAPKGKVMQRSFGPKVKCIMQDGADDNIFSSWPR